jgi:hypothetical protein
MATWVRAGTGTPPSATNADLVGTYELDNATAPGDFDPAAVTSVRFQWTIAKTGTYTSPEDQTFNAVARLTTDAVGTDLASVDGTNTTIDNANPSRSADLTDSTGIPTGLTTAQWEGAEVNPLAATPYTTFNQNMGPDGVTVAFTALTVTITYTPGATQVDGAADLAGTGAFASSSSVTANGVVDLAAGGAVRHLEGTPNSAAVFWV